MTDGGESPTHDMRSRVARGLGWVGASQIALQIIRTGGAIVVARLLAPEEYGLAMLALVFASLVLVFSDLALGAALVQRKNLTEADRCTAFWITIASGIIFTVLGVALSGPVANLYDQPDVQPLLAVLSLSFIVTAVGARDADRGRHARRHRGGRGDRGHRRRRVGDHRPAARHRGGHQRAHVARILVAPAPHVLA
jgi:hypothetical protein